MEENTDHLFNATIDWLRSAFEILSASPDLVDIIDGIESWVADSSGSLVKLPYTCHYSLRFSSLIFDNNRHWKRIESLVEFDPDLRHLNSSTTNLTPNSWGRLPLSSVFNELLPTPTAQQEKSILLAAATSECRIREFLARIRSNSVNHIVLWPMTGLRTRNPIDLKDGYKFRSLTDGEKIRLLSLGIIQPRYMKIVPSHFTNWYGLTYETSVKRFRNETDPDPATDIDETPIEDFLACASVVTGIQARHAGGQSSAPNLIFGEANWSMSTRSRDLSGYFIRENLDTELSSSQLNHLLFTWNLLRSQRSKRKANGRHDRALANAIRRIYLAGTRLRPDEQLLDLIIAAESVYLNDELPEKRFRLSINAANWTEKTSKERSEVFQAFKSAYDKRSSIVHGKTVSEKELEELVGIVRSTMFGAIKRLIDIRRNGGDWPDWDSMIFSRLGVD
jgi:hypothetical protein